MSRLKATPHTTTYSSNSIGTRQKFPGRDSNPTTVVIYDFPTRSLSTKAKTKLKIAAFKGPIQAGAGMRTDTQSRRPADSPSPPCRC
ncbi:uncharacterized protein SPSK_04716 [Sporothrix schenckii 1099-18]|uniref:Uncharacterized protein n=1 Tax=Sporothrix schenckii 1099-18 TaxID=1397361 RepID=A0A0F2M172_SPOSC|nr:uncharacterized protein SPSK_04716 [Sporothrix schenckii 1099-18]KJR82854.1 hypothetical protein SPSK_04716 [Sporothrix schenckii 1099-18]